MRIAGAGSAFPQHVYDQHAIIAALKDYWGERLERPELLQRLHARSGVEQRHLVLPTEAYAAVDTWGKANTLWIEKAEELGYQAICRAITPLGVAPEEINALYVASVTGIASPSLDAKLINRMGLSANIKRVPIFGLGCVAVMVGESVLRIGCVAVAHALRISIRIRIANPVTAGLLRRKRRTTSLRRPAAIAMPSGRTPSPFPISMGAGAGGVAGCVVVRTACTCGT